MSTAAKATVLWLLIVTALDDLLLGTHHKGLACGPREEWIGVVRVTLCRCIKSKSTSIRTQV